MKTILTTLLLLGLIGFSHAQITKSKRKAKISFNPKFEVNQALNYTIKSYRVTPTEQGADTSSTSYDINLTVLENLDSTIIYTLSFSDEVSNVATALYKEVPPRISYNYSTRKIRLENDSTITRIYREILDGNDLSNEKYQKVDRKIRKEIVNTLRTSGRLLSLYYKDHSFGVFKEDSTQSKDMFGKMSPEYIEEGVFKEDKEFVYHYNKHKESSGSMNAMLSEAVKKEFGEETTLVKDEDEEKNEPISYSKTEVVFNKQGLMTKFSKKSKKSFFGTQVISEKEYILNEL